MSSHYVRTTAGTAEQAPQELGSMDHPGYRSQAAFTLPAEDVRADPSLAPLPVAAAGLTTAGILTTVGLIGLGIYLWKKR